MAFVLDASVALAWCFPDESTEYARTVLRKLAEDRAVVPAIWPLEVANGLRAGHRRNRISPDQIATASVLLRELVVEIEQPLLSRIFETTLALAQAYTLSVYDATYLELAHRIHCPLATADRKLREVAKALGVELR